MPTFPGTPETAVVAEGAGAGGLLWLLALAALLAFIAYGAVLAYHWFRYSFSRSTAVMSLIVYAVGGGILFLVLFSAAFAL